jgi:hypothetical protein
MDPRTAAYLKALAKAHEANRKIVDAAQEICTCANCIEARASKTLSACNNAKISRDIHEKIIGIKLDNYIPKS